MWHTRSESRLVCYLSDRLKLIIAEINKRPSMLVHDDEPLARMRY
jgi:hypothetical protein